MVLVLNGVLQTKSPQDTRSLYSSHPVYGESAARLLAESGRVVGPVGLLYVMQREYAATVPHDKIVEVIGTDEMTTCIAVVVRHSGSGAVAVGHFDGSDTHEAVCTIIQRVQDLALGYPEGRMELQLVGGYSDPNNYSEDLFSNIMSAVHKHPAEVDLTLACVGQLNSTIRGDTTWPVIYGIGVDVKTGDLFPASFPERGPECALRSTRHLSGTAQTLDIYECSTGLLRIGPFNYQPLRGADLWLEQSDEFILRHLSTSPEVEPATFVPNMRATLKYIQENPFPAVTVFRHNLPHYFRRDENGMWVPLGF